MVGFLDGYGVHETVADVVHDLGKEVRAAIERQAGQVAIQEGGPESAVELPNTERLWIGYQSDALRNANGSISEGVSHTYTTGVKPFGINLLLHSTFQANPDAPEHLIRVAGFRTGEKYPDYNVQSAYGNTCFRITLGQVGLYAVAGPLPAEPYGDAVYDPQASIFGLDKDMKDRLGVVAEGIMTNVAAFNLLAQGDSVRVMIAAADKPIDLAALQAAQRDSYDA